MSNKAFFRAQWIAADPTYPDLSTIDTGLVNEITGESVIRGVPRLAHVTGLTTSSTVLCTTKPVVIIGIITGNANAFEA